LVSAPYSLPRWWPRTTRVENVDSSQDDRRSQWTKVLETADGRGVRADYRCTDSTRCERYAWEQQLAGTPFARHLRRSSLEISLREAGGATEVRLAATQTMRGLSRLGSPMMRGAQGKTLDEALDGIALTLGAE